MKYKMNNKSKKEMNIVVENTEYSLFVYFLLSKNWKNDFYILSENIYERMKEKFYENNISVKKIEVFVYRKNIFEYYFKKLSEILYFFLNRNKKIFGNDNLLRVPFINFNIIEDGSINYLLPKKEKLELKIIIKRILRLEPIRYIAHGYDKRIKKIYLTGIAPIPEEIKHKVELINLKELWNKKTEEEQKEILDIFDFDFEIVEILKKRKNILFTQPLYEDGTLTEEEKIEIYRKILKNYDEEDVVIKIHPRETTDYKKAFPNVVVLEQKFPSELLNVLDIKFEKAITIFSTAACTLDKNIEVDFYGTEVHPKIFEKFGCHNHIHKTNSFIKEE